MEFYQDKEKKKKKAVHPTAFVNIIVLLFLQCDFYGK